MSQLLINFWTEFNFLSKSWSTCWFPVVRNSTCWSTVDHLNSTFGPKNQLFGQLLINFSFKFNLLINCWSTSWSTKVDQLLINSWIPREINKLINSWLTWWNTTHRSTLIQLVDQLLINFWSRNSRLTFFQNILNVYHVLEGPRDS